MVISYNLDRMDNNIQYIRCGYENMMDISTELDGRPFLTEDQFVYEDRRKTVKPDLRK